MKKLFQNIITFFYDEYVMPTNILKVLVYLDNNQKKLPKGTEGNDYLPAYLKEINSLISNHRHICVPSKTSELYRFSTYCLEHLYSVDTKYYNDTMWEQHVELISNVGYLVKIAQ